jgi:hypothetical protein
MKSYLRGFVYFGRAGCAVECVVHDISDSGARLKLLGRPPLVDTIELHLPIKGRVHRARVLWSTVDKIRVSFMEVGTASVLHSDVDALSRRIIDRKSEIVVLKRSIERLQSAFPPLGA